jgi:O-antigen ligase
MATFLVVRRIDIRVVGLMAFVGLLLGYLFNLVLSSESIEAVADRWLEATFQEGYASNRDILFAAAWDAWLERPIFGGGLYSFNAVTQGLDQYPHNVFLEVAQEGGIFGLMFVTTWLLHVVLKFRRSVNYYSEIAFSMMALILGSALFSGDLYDSRLLFIFGMLAVTPTVRPERIPSAYAEFAYLQAQSHQMGSAQR